MIDESTFWGFLSPPLTFVIVIVIHGVCFVNAQEKLIQIVEM